MTKNHRKIIVLNGHWGQLSVAHIKVTRISQNSPYSAIAIRDVDDEAVLVPLDDIDDLIAALNEARTSTPIDPLEVLFPVNPQKEH